METIIGIDLGTTNSEVAIVRDGRPVVLPDDDGDPILPSVVGLDAQGRLLVGKPARNQFVLAPERTVRSIKRKMGQESTVELGDQRYSPQEVSAIILRTLKQRAEKALGEPVAKAVITVPAFFTEGQRDATREAGVLAGLEVVRIINEPTAAVLTYDPNPPEMERLLVYDLGGGTFDVSIAQVEGGVVEILASRGDTQLGCDDFDQLLLDMVCDRFKKQHGIDLRASIAARSRVLRAVEDAKKMLSTEAIAPLEEEFIAEAKGVPLHLRMEVERDEYEALIEPLLAKTLSCVDRALTDAGLQAQQVDKVVLVGGATRTPLVHRLLQDRLGRPVHAEVEPDLAVAMGAAVQGALIAGMEVGPVLVDITPHTLGISAIDELNGLPSIHAFAPIIERNTPLPATRTEVFYTAVDGQKVAQIRVFQGEDQDTRYNTLVGEFDIEGLAQVQSGNQIVVRLDLDLNGILKVTATERKTGLARHVTIDNAMERFRQRHRLDAVDRLDAVFRTAEVEVEDEDEVEDEAGVEAVPVEVGEELSPAFGQASDLIAKAERVADAANSEDAGELRALAADLRSAVDRRSEEDVRRISVEVEDLIFYLEDV
jgi:molecular chaperone DnaK